MVNKKQIGKLNLIQVKKNFFSSKDIIKKMKRHDYRHATRKYLQIIIW